MQLAASTVMNVRVFSKTRTLIKQIRDNQVIAEGALTMCAYNKLLKTCPIKTASLCKQFALFNKYVLL
jgi:hypothetical protein